MNSSADLGVLLPSAEEAMEKLVLAEAEKATESIRRETAVENERKALIDRLSKPSGVSDDEALKRTATIVNNAIKNGLTEVQVYRFPNTMCTDRGRAINQQEPGWEASLTGIPKEIFEFWKRQLQSRGYKLYAQIVEFPDGVPGDVGLTLKWG